MKISVSMLSSYLYCPRKLFIERVLGIRPEIPKEALIRGSIRHRVYEKINLCQEELVKSISKKDFEFILGAYKLKFIKILKQTIVSSKEELASIEVPLTEFFKEIKPYIENEAEYRAKKVFEFIKETGLTGDGLWEELAPKIKPEYRVSSGILGLRGIIDELEVYPEFCVPVELKTGKMPSEGVWPGHKVQVGAYALLLEEKFGAKVEKAVVRYLDSNASREVAINPFLRQEVKEIIEKVQNMLDSAEIPDFVGNENKCGACDLKEVCFDKNTINEKLKSEISNSQNGILRKTKDLNRT